MTIQHENQNLIRAGYPPLADTETLHTPGPWLAVVTDTTCGGEPAIWEITDKHGGVIAEDISHNPANARLIAAAPDLLSALNLLLDKLHAHCPGLIDCEYTESAITKAEMAVAKAKGIA